MSVLRRKRRHTHLDIDSSRSHFALRASRRAGTMPGASMGRRSSSGAVQRHQVQLRALGVLQLQRAVTPKFVSARAAALQRASSTNGNDSRNSKETVTRAIASASRSMRSRRLGPPPARVIRSPQSLHTAKITTLYIPIFRGVPEDQHPTCGQHLGGYQCKRQHCSQSCWEMAILTPKMSLLCSILTCVNTTDNLEPFSSSS